MKTDSQLQHDVAEEISWDPSIRHEDIGVAVKNGVVTLSGFVKTYPEKLAAEKAARHVYCVRGIADEIQVRFDDEFRTDDTAIAEKILTALSHNITVPREHVQVTVDKGWVKLAGMVDWNYQREEAVRIAGHIKGVVGVTNYVEVRNEPAPKDVKSRIVAAFERSADIDASHISVATEGGTVKLSGKVPSWKDRHLAEAAAWGCPGVSKVEDQLTVA